MAEIRIALEEVKEDSESGAAVEQALHPKRASRRWLWAVLTGALIIAVSGLVLLVFRSATHVGLKERPLTSYPGYLGEPTLSPDGSQFAFVWDGGVANAPPQLYVSLVERGSPLKLTNTPHAEAAFPSWSPDGQTIAFLRFQENNRPGKLILIPALGGPEREVDDVSPRVISSVTPRSVGVSWSPDGNWLYFSSGSEPRTLVAVPAGGGEKRRLFQLPAGTFGGDYGARVAPDGKRLAFIRQLSDREDAVFVAELRNGNTAFSPRQLTHDHGPKSSVVWSADGAEIIYVSGELNSERGIYRMRASGGPAVRIMGIGDYARDVAISHPGGRFVYSRSLRDYNIWRMPLPAGGGPAAAVKVLSSTRFEASPAYSPDGTHIAFSSNRGGVRQIWVADADGSNPVPLTNFPDGVAGSPRWSPDGRMIVFDAHSPGLSDVFSVPAGGGKAIQLTDHPAEDHLPCYSMDGKWIYFGSTRAGLHNLFRIPAKGGEAVPMTQDGGLFPAVSKDGRWIYYSRVGGSLWRISVDGGEKTRILDDGSLYSNYLFAVTATGIYYPALEGQATSSVPLRFYRFSDGKTVEVARFGKPPVLLISVSPDEKSLLYTQLDSSIDEVLLVENFR